MENIDNKQDNKAIVDNNNDINNNRNIILGLDVSTTTIGCAIVLNDGSEHGKIVELTHVAPKVPKKLKGSIESLFVKKQIFNDEFLVKWKNLGITEVVIEEPLVTSNNAETVATLLRFNGMISDCIYNVLGIVPKYISSYDARKFAFPELMAIRKFDKNGEKYKPQKLIKSVKENSFVLFGGYPWDVDKKLVLQGKVARLFPEITWLYNKKNELKKENFDATDAYVCVLGQMNKEKHDNELTFSTSDVKVNETNVTYQLKYWDTEISQSLSL